MLASNDVYIRKSGDQSSGTYFLDPFSSDMCNVNNILAAYVRTINGRVNVLFDIVSVLRIQF